MLSINDHPKIREVFKGFERKEISLLYSVGQTGPTEADELIYSNYEFREAGEMSLFPEEN